MYDNKLPIEFSGFLLPLVVLATALLVADIPLVIGANNSSEVTELITLNVMCSQATMSASLAILCDNYSLIHFPSEVNMFDPHLESSVEVMVGRSPTLVGGSFVTFLNYGFDNISPEEARTNADTMISSMSSAFEVSFIWMDTNTSDTTVAVAYTATGPSDLTDFAELLASTCFAEDVAGFSNALSLMPAFTVGIVAYKDAGSFNWVTSITAAKIGTSIPVGSDSHTIDVLDILGVLSLAPSPYSYDDNVGAYASRVMLTITSSDPLSFVSCQPPLASEPNEKGWTDSALPNYIMTQFSFGSNSTHVTELSYTFSGTVIPEFTSLTLILTLVLATSGTFILKKRIRKSPPRSTL